MSRFSGDRIVDYCRVPESKVVVIPNGVADRFRPLSPQAIADVRQRLGLPHRYVLCVGSLEDRKNLRRLLAAWRMVEPLCPDVSLVLAGGTSHVFSDAGLPELPRSVMLAGTLDDETLPAVYGGAELFAFPSLYEGFGLPVLEAMACGTPVITSSVTSLPEIAGDAALLVDPRSSEAIAAGITQLLGDPRRCDDLRQRGLRRASSFGWEQTAALTWQTLEESAD